MRRWLRTMAANIPRQGGNSRIRRATANSISVSEEAVVWGYRLFLDREPESQARVVEKLNRLPEIADLRRDFLQSAEFKANNDQKTPTLTGDEPPMSIELEQNRDGLQSLFQHVQKTWQQLGESEPYWSVLTHERYRKNQIERTRDEFYTSGRDDVQLMLSTLERNDIDYTGCEFCLEFGCGVGRNLPWLAKAFGTVIGVDISKPHLDIAEQFLRGEGVANVQLRHLKQVPDVDSLTGVDLIYTVIVLQHNPPPVIAYILRGLLRALRTRGIAYFQVPTYKQGYAFSYDSYLSKLGKRREMEMHVLPQKNVFEIIAAEGCRLIEVREDVYTGLHFGEVSNTFVVQKS